MTHGTLAGLALLILLLAGCGGNTPPPMTPTSSSSTTTTTSASSLVESIVSSAYYFVSIAERPADGLLRIFHTPAQRAEALHCAGHPGVDRLSGREIGWFHLWNRTGLVRYHQQPTWTGGEEGKPAPLFDHTITLPPDPPYLIGFGSTCGGPYTVEARTAQMQESEDVLVYHDWTVEVRIPTGKSDGDAFFATDGNIPILNDQPIHGDWDRQGQLLGDAYVHAPDHHEDAGWFIHSYYKITEDGWEGQHGEVAMPGTYRYRVHLDAPAITEVVWTATTSGYSFNSTELQGQGFAQPFRLYDDHTVR